MGCSSALRLAGRQGSDAAADRNGFYARYERGANEMPWSHFRVLQCFRGLSAGYPTGRVAEAEEKVCKGKERMNIGKEGAENPLPLLI